MNALKNIEALVLVAVAVTFSATALLRAPAEVQAVEPTLAKDSKMIQVVVSAKRLTPAEKAQQAG